MVAVADTERVTASVFRVLSTLGDTTLDVARQLGLRGCRGVRGSAVDDPLSDYLRDCMSETEIDGLHFLVSDLVVTAMDGSNGHFEVPLPSTVSLFVQEFDAGLHAELERDDAPVELSTEGRRLLPATVLPVAFVR